MRLAVLQLAELTERLGGGLRRDRTDRERDKHFIYVQSWVMVAEMTNLELLALPISDNTGDNRNWSATGRLLLRQRLGKPGRTISANINYSFSNNEMTGFNKSLTQTDINQDGNYENDIVNQRFDQLSTNSLKPTTSIPGMPTRAERTHIRAEAMSSMLQA